MFFGGKKLVALDIGTSSIKLAEVDFGRKGPTLTRFGVYPLASGLVSGGEINDAQTVGQAIASLVANTKCKRKFAATGMWGSSVIVKKISMPRMEPQLVGEQLKWEAEQYIPFDINEVSLEHHIIQSRGGPSESMDVLLIAAKQEVLFRVLEAVETAGLKCAVVDVSGFALANCFEANYGVLSETVAVLNIGAGVTNLVVIDRGEVIFCRDVAIGGGHYTAEISKAMGVSLGEAEALKISASLGQEVPEEVNGILAGANDQVADEIRNSLEFFNATSGQGHSISRLFVCGGSIFVPGLLDHMSRSIGLPLQVFDPFTRIGYDSRVLSADYISQIKAISAVALGLALRKIGD